MKILRSSLLEQANLDWTYSKLCLMKRYLFENSGIWRWPIFPMTPTVFQAWQTIVKRSMSKASSGVGEKVISRLKYSFTWKITFGEKLKTILFWGLHMTCHNFISSPLVHTVGNIEKWNAIYFDGSTLWVLSQPQDGDNVQHNLHGRQDGPLLKGEWKTTWCLFSTFSVQTCSKYGNTFLRKPEFRHSQIKYF